MEGKVKVAFWAILAVLYISLAYINYSGYISIKDKVGGIYVGKERLIVAKPTELNESDKAKYVELSHLFSDMAIINAAGSALAAVAAGISAKYS